MSFILTCGLREQSELLCVRDKICELQQGSEYTSEQQTVQVVQQVIVDSVVQATKQEKLQKGIDKLQLALQKLIEQKQNTVTSIQQSVSTTPKTDAQLSYETQQNSHQNNNLNLHTPSTRSVMPAWNREFKISGQIGEPGQEDKLTFSSLATKLNMD